MIAGAFHVILLLAALLCSLVAGLLFTFAVVVMPGLATLDDAGFLRGFQVIDRVIQNNQPLFMLVWMGSVVTVIAAAVLSVRAAAGADRALIITAAAIYFLAVQAPTVTINIPLNNRIQRLDIATASAATHHDERETFERRWNQWNAMRTIASILVAVLLLYALLRV
jgi:uncharacterized membrane protein